MRAQNAPRLPPRARAGVGRVKQRDNATLWGTDAEPKLRQPDDSFWKKYAAECSRVQIAVDVFIFWCRPGPNPARTLGAARAPADAVAPDSGASAGTGVRRGLLRSAGLYERRKACSACADARAGLLRSLQRSSTGAARQAVSRNAAFLSWCVDTRAFSSTHSVGCST